MREIAEQLRWQPEKVQFLIDVGVASQLISLDTPIAEDGFTPLEFVRPTGDQTSYTQVFALERSTAVNYALEQLTTRQQLVITRRFGLAGCEPETLEEIGQSLNLTRERIRQIEEIAMKRLRHYVCTVRLRPFRSTVDADDRLEISHEKSA